MFNKKTYIMKTHFPFCKGFIMAAALTSIMGLSSCLDDDDETIIILIILMPWLLLRVMQMIVFSSSWMTVQHCYR